MDWTNPSLLLRKLIPLRYPAVSLLIAVVYVSVEGGGVQCLHKVGGPADPILFIPLRLANRTNGWLKNLWWRPKREFYEVNTLHKECIIKEACKETGQVELHAGKQAQNATNYSWPVATSIRMNCFSLQANEAEEWFLGYKVPSDFDLVQKACK